jgi:endonuclease/exonuclease/phosphatase family metal-dependent hydrolase
VNFRIVTLNAGLMSVFGGRIAFSPFVEERLVELPTALRNLDADVIALQEVYRQRHREWIVERLRDRYPFVAYSRKRHNLGLESSLMVLSKTCVSADLKLFRDAPLDEKLFDNKGWLTCEIELGAHRLKLINLHTTAGGLWLHPESSRSNRIRAAQIDQFLSASDAGPAVTMLAGDFNAGPGVSEENFLQVLEQGFASVYDLLHGQDAKCTWDPLNRLNRESPHKTSPPQRIDHVFMRNSDLSSGRVRPFSATICCRDEVVPISGGDRVTVSDHFGLCVDIEIKD